ncbi:MAG: signal recognition particle receptor subunit alpha, partial [Bacillota bacterium]|nr:signal recognition particle receptor subunit alpha [Bacillota bacterium]
MAFSQLSARLQDALRRLRGKGKVTEADLEETLRALRLALLEADVNYQVVKDFLARVRERALGQEVLRSLTPAQQVIKVVYEQMAELLGGEESGFLVSAPPPAAVALVGVQGSGKTSTAAKLAHLLKQKGKRPLLVAADVYRPAAAEQLEVLGRRLGVPVFKGREGSDPVEICCQAMAEARQRGYDSVLLDTAGRLHVDAEMMGELKRIKEAVRPAEILLVADAMTGQDAVRMASTFQEQLGLTGVILTKLDGDARGGAALSIRAVTGCPVKFGTWGEGPQALEPFYPRRMASRILGLGDV